MCRILCLLFLFVMLSFLNLQAQMVHVTKTDQGFWINEANEKVMFFQREPRHLNDEYSRNNYFHPLLSLRGDTITEDFPVDHLHHRGIFWAWSQILIQNEQIASSWDLENFSQKITDVEFRTDQKGRGELLYTSFWYASNPDDPLMRERVKVLVYPRSSRYRRIDFRIELQALENELKLGGSDNEKGYGGFSIRMKTDRHTLFYNENGEQIQPQTMSIDAGNYVNIVNKTSKFGVVVTNNILSLPHAGWILRQTESMQNCAWPGRNAVDVIADKPVVLEYSLLVHNGKLQKRAIDRILSK